MDEKKTYNAIQQLPMEGEVSQHQPLCWALRLENQLFSQLCVRATRSVLNPLKQIHLIPLKYRFDKNVRLSRIFLTKLRLFHGFHYAVRGAQKPYLLLVFSPNLMGLFLWPLRPPPWSSSQYVYKSQMVNLASVKKKVRIQSWYACLYRWDNLQLIRQPAGTIDNPFLPMQFNGLCVINKQTWVFAKDNGVALDCTEATNVISDICTHGCYAMKKCLLFGRLLTS